MRFVVSVVTLIAPRASNSSSNILFLDQGLVCQRVFLTSLGLPFVQYFRGGQSPAVFHCYLLQEMEGQRTLLPYCSDKALVLGCIMSLDLGCLASLVLLSYPQAIALPLPQMHWFSPGPRDNNICYPAPSRLNLLFCRGDKQGLVPLTYQLLSPSLRPVPWRSLSQDSHQSFLCVPVGVHEGKVCKSLCTLFSPRAPRSLASPPLSSTNSVFILAELFLTACSSICPVS